MKAIARNDHASSNDEMRFAEIYQRYGRLLHAYCVRRTGASLAPDAVAEVFLIAWKKIDEVPIGEGTLPWLYGVAYRVVSHQWRSRARGRNLIDRLAGLAVLETPTPDLVILRREEDRLVLKAASRLKPVDQEILRLTLWEGLSHADVAGVLDLEPSAVKQRAYRARRALAVEYQRLNREHQPPAAQRGGGS